MDYWNHSYIWCIVINLILICIFLVRFYDNGDLYVASDNKSDSLLLDDEFNRPEPAEPLQIKTFSTVESAAL